MWSCAAIAALWVAATVQDPEDLFWTPLFFMAGILMYGIDKIIVRKIPPVECDVCHQVIPHVMTWRCGHCNHTNQSRSLYLPCNACGRKQARVACPAIDCHNDIQLFARATSKAPASVDWIPVVDEQEKTDPEIAELQKKKEDIFRQREVLIQRKELATEKRALVRLEKDINDTLLSMKGNEIERLEEELTHAIDKGISMSAVLQEARERISDEVKDDVYRDYLINHFEFVIKNKYMGKL